MTVLGTQIAFASRLLEPETTGAPFVGDRARRIHVDAVKVSPKYERLRRFVDGGGRGYLSSVVAIVARKATLKTALIGQMAILCIIRQNVHNAPVCAQWH